MTEEVEEQHWNLPITSTDPYYPFIDKYVKITLRDCLGVFHGTAKDIRTFYILLEMDDGRATLIRRKSIAAIAEWQREFKSTRNRYGESKDGYSRAPR